MSSEVVIYDSSTAPHPSFAINEVSELVHKSTKYELVSADEIGAQLVREKIQQLKQQILVSIPDLGSEHPKTLALYSELGLVFSNAGHLVEAERMVNRAWLGRKNAHGAHHLRSYREQTNLGSVLYKLRKYKEANEIYTAAVTGLEDLVGKSSDELLEPLAGLGRTCHAQSLLKEAEVCYNRIYMYHLNMSGADAEITLMAGNQLAVVYKDQAYFQLADQLGTQLLESATRVLGEDHEVTQQAIENLARIRVGEGRGEEAENMYRRSLEYQEGVFGVDGAPTIHTVGSIAKLMWDRGDVAGAERFRRRALDSLLTTQGELHALTLVAIHELGTMMYNLERIREGEALLRRCWVGRKMTLGVLNEASLEAAVSLAKALNVVAEWKHEPDFADKLLESESLMRIAVDGYGKMFGMRSLNNADANLVLADFLLEHLRYEEADTHYKLVYAVYLEYLGDNSVLTAKAAYGVGACLQYLRQFSEAVPYFDLAHKIYLNAWGMEDGHSNGASRHRRVIADAAQMHKYTKTRAKQSEYDKRALMFSH